MDSEISRPALASTHPPIQWAMRAVSLKRKQPDFEVTTHLPLVLRLRISAAIRSLPHMPVWNAQG